MIVTKIGFTGTQEGMTAEQHLSFVEFMREMMMNGITQFHHGDCVGADEQAHDVMNGRAFIVIHPPEDDKKRAGCYPISGSIRSKKPYLERNHAIVDDTDALVATPAGPERLRSGTWATIRYAAKQGRTVTIIWPDGNLEVRVP